MSDTKTFNGDQKIKLIQIINEGMQVTQEIETLTGGLNDTIKAIAEACGISVQSVYQWQKPPKPRTAQSASSAAADLALPHPRSSPIN